MLVPLVRPVEAVRPSPPVPARTPDKKWDPAEAAGRAHAEGIHRAAAAAGEGGRSGPLLSTVMHMPFAVLLCGCVVPFALGLPVGSVVCTYRTYEVWWWWWKIIKPNSKTNSSCHSHQVHPCFCGPQHKNIP